MDYTVNYKDGHSQKTNACVCNGIKDLDGSISGIVMDGGRVNFVVDENGKKVTPEEIGSNQTEEF